MLIELNARATRNPIPAHGVPLRRGKTRLSGQSGRVDAETLIDDGGKIR